MRLGRKNSELKIPHDWFAWQPIRVDGQNILLETVTMEKVVGLFGYFYIYHVKACK